MRLCFTGKLSCSVTSLLLLIYSALAVANDCLDVPVIQNSEMGYIDDNGQPGGVHWEFLSAIEERSGICINKVLLPIPRLWSAIEQGSVDGGIVFRSPDREFLTLPVAKTLRLQTVVVPRNSLTLNQYEDLKQLFIGVTRGSVLDERFDADNSLIKVEVSSYQQLVKMMAAGRLDAIAGTFNSIAIELEKSNTEDSVNLAGSLNLGWREQWLQLSRKSEHTHKIPALALATNNLREEGVFDNIMMKYYGSHWQLIGANQQSN